MSDPHPASTLLLVAADLNAARDELNVGIAAAEARLRGLHLSEPASVPLLDGARLAWDRRAGKYGLHVSFPGGSWQPVARTSAAMRCEAVRALPELLEAMVDANESLVRRIGDAARAAAAFAEGKR